MIFIDIYYLLLFFTVNEINGIINSKTPFSITKVKGAREYDGFDYWTSFFTHRGYAVFRPNFRGSSGYGKQFADSQMQGWRLTMQEDITVATKWLIEKNIADPNRICIVAAVYGGYAAAMATVKSPDLFQCAISFAGVMDLERLVNKSRHFLNKKLVR
tara:strand:- start:4994 stop:5467 length:474 start_codon:yes stop_codon:yes gene_type:complete